MSRPSGRKRELAALLADVPEAPSIPSVDELPASRASRARRSPAPAARAKATPARSPARPSAAPPADDGSSSDAESTTSSDESVAPTGGAGAAPAMQPLQRSSSKDAAAAAAAAAASTAAAGGQVVPVVGGAAAAAPVLLVDEANEKKWRDWRTRWASALAFIAIVLVYLFLTRQVGVALFVFVIQTLIYKELVGIAINDSKERALPGFHWFYTFWFAVAALYMYSETLKAPVLAWLDTNPAAPRVLTTTLGFIAHKYQLIAFGGYSLGLVAFVLSLRSRRNFRYQFSRLAYCHVALAVVVMQSTLLVSVVWKGLIWFLLPISLVVVNDSFAYIFGFLFGRTPLIALSPKKTWEGFIGGAVSTLVFAVAATWALTTLEWQGINRMMVCPAGDNLGFSAPICDIDTQLGGIYKYYPLSEWLKDTPAAGDAWVALAGALPWVQRLGAAVWLSEMQLHALLFAAFASMVAPFGGFFASGFKRAFKIKDFGNTIPGHGGFTDRMDCQLVMGSFTFVYLTYVIIGGAAAAAAAAPVTVASLLEAAKRLAPADAEALLTQLRQHVAGAVVGVASGGAGGSAGGGEAVVALPLGVGQGEL